MFKFIVTGILLVTLGLNNLTFVRPAVASAISNPALNKVVDHLLKTPPIGNLMVPKTLLPTLQYYLPDSEVISYSRSAGAEQVAVKLENTEISDLIIFKEAGDLWEEELSKYVKIKEIQTIYSVPGGATTLQVTLDPEI